MYGRGRFVVRGKNVELVPWEGKVTRGGEPSKKKGAINREKSSHAPKREVMLQTCDQRGGEKGAQKKKVWPPRERLGGKVCTSMKYYGAPEETHKEDCGVIKSGKKGQKEKHSPRETPNTKLLQGREFAKYKKRTTLPAISGTKFCAGTKKTTGRSRAREKRGRSHEKESCKDLVRRVDHLGRGKLRLQGSRGPRVGVLGKGGGRQEEGKKASSNRKAKGGGIVFTCTINREERG